MESTPKKELGKLSDNKREIITQAFAKVCKNVPSTEQDWDNTNENKDLLENQNNRYRRPEISDDFDFNITDKCSQQTADDRRTDERTTDERTARHKGSHCYLIQDDLQEFQEKPLDEEASEPALHKRFPIERSKVVDYEAKTCELICEGDPKEKALRYLEESGVLRMFQNLAAGIVHDRPQQPLLYMMKALEQAKDEDWGELPDFPRFTDVSTGNENGKRFETNS